MTYIVSINNKKYEVEVEKGQANIVQVTEALPETPAVSAVQGSEQKTAPAPVSTPPASVSLQGEAVKSPIPGTVIDIKVNVGTKVKKGDVLVIIEAMKMENEIAATKDGTVAQVLVSKGASVEIGAVLVSIQ